MVVTNNNNECQCFMRHSDIPYDAESIIQLDMYWNYLIDIRQNLTICMAYRGLFLLVIQLVVLADT